MARSAGVLLSITSLPSPYGIGTIGKEARKFADFLKKSGQTIWQILPVGPTSYGDSPYQSFSTSASSEPQSRLLTSSLVKRPSSQRVSRSMR